MGTYVIGIIVAVLVGVGAGVLAAKRNADTTQSVKGGQNETHHGESQN